MIQVPLRKLATALVSVSILALPACGEPATPLPNLPGQSHRPAKDATVPANSAQPSGPVRWERWNELSTYRLAIPRAPTQHLGGDHEAEILANPAAAAYPDLGPAKTLGEGAVLVERLFPAGNDTADGLFVMVRRAEALETKAQPTPDDPAFPWEMLVLTPDGTLEERGSIESCARCHAEAPHDGVFGRAQ